MFKMLGKEDFYGATTQPENNAREFTSSTMKNTKGCSASIVKSTTGTESKVVVTPVMQQSTISQAPLTSIKHSSIRSTISLIS